MAVQDYDEIEYFFGSLLGGIAKAATKGIAKVASSGFAKLASKGIGSLASKGLSKIGGLASKGLGKLGGLASKGMGKLFDGFGKFGSRLSKMGNVGGKVLSASVKLQKLPQKSLEPQTTSPNSSKA